MRATILSLTTIAIACAAVIAAARAQQGNAQGARAQAGGQEKPAAGPARQLGATPEEKAILEGVGAFAKAYEAGNAAAIAEMFLEESMIVDPEGNAVRGKAAVAALYGAGFKQNPGLKLDATVLDIRFVTPDLARVEGKTRLTTSDGDASEFTGFTALLVHRDANWRIAEMHEYAAPAADITPYERLKELEWMVGEWVEEGDKAKSQSIVRWADNKSYLVRTYSIEPEGEKPSSGTMFIGWDPQSGQIKSWLFNSEGGHGEGLWNRTAENEWVIKATGVLRDGRPTSATQIQTAVNKDTVKVSSIDRIIGGVVAPDITDVIMVRKPPQPGAAPKPAAGQ
jgi:uncharacterized protein (TIGR02246 family)